MKLGAQTWKLTFGTSWKRDKTTNQNLDLKIMKEKNVNVEEKCKVKKIVEFL